MSEPQPDPTQLSEESARVTHTSFPKPGMAELPDRVLVGAAYYAEYQPYERLDADLDLMAAGGFGVIRVGESVWSTWEPRDGVFELDWLQPVLDGAHARGIAVVLGTPTYAVPPWLRAKYPETTAHSATGVAIPYGMRQDVDYSHPTFRYLAERVVRKIVDRYVGHPAIIGWQVDNEPGHKLFYNPQVFAGFLGYLKDRYGTVEELNRRWGLTYWSHRIDDWSELWTPDGNRTPSYDLAWRRYQATLGHDLIAWQAELVRSLVPAHQFVTTCIAMGQQGQDITVIGEPLDIAGANVYYATQDGLELPGAQGLEGGLAPFFVPWAGPAYLALQADTARGTRQAPFLVTETNATSIGGSADNFPAYDGQWRQVAWHLVGAGRVTTVGTIPDRELAGRLARYLARTSLPAEEWRDARPETVTVTVAVNAAGERLRFVHNWSWTPTSFAVPGEVADLLDGEPLAAGAKFELGPWDVRVLRERHAG